MLIPEKSAKSAPELLLSSETNRISTVLLKILSLFDKPILFLEIERSCAQISEFLNFQIMLDYLITFPSPNLLSTQPQVRVILLGNTAV